MKEYKKSSAQVALIIVLALISTAVGAGLFASWFSDESLGLKIGLSIPGLLFLLPGFAAIYVLFRGRGACLRLHENGLFFRRGGKESATTWDEIDSYMQETACRLVKKDGEVIEFGQGLKGADEVARTIHGETLKLMLPRFKAAIAQGSPVEFKGWKPVDKFPLGKGLSNYMQAHSGFTIDSKGITENDEGRRILWSDVTDFGVAEETLGLRTKLPIRVLSITDASQSFRTRYGLLSNAHVLLALCQEMAGQSTKRHGAD